MSDFVIRKRLNFPEPFKLVRKTLLISFPEYERIGSDRSRVMSRDVPETLLLAQIPEVDFLVVCWIFETPSRGGPSQWGSPGVSWTA